MVANDSTSSPALDSPRQPVLIPARKPVLRTQRIALFEREVLIRLSPAAIDMLFDGASILSEGEVFDSWYGGSTMMTMDLTRASAQLSEACDLATAHQLETLLMGDSCVHERTRAIALREAEAHAGRALDNPRLDVRVHRSGRHIHLDVDVEATLASEEVR